MNSQKKTLETPVVFACQGQSLVGIIHKAETPATVGVLIIVGGPQYRVGSHRQFVLLARHLAGHGIPTMRFDARGMGDSEGEPRRFDQLDEDIRAAVDKFYKACPELKQVFLWGLCDGASAAVFYGYQDERIKGQILLNPWVFTEHGAAKTVLKHYYLQRLLSKDFWFKVFSFRFDFTESLASLLNLLKHACLNGGPSKPIESGVKIDKNLALPIRMRECLRQFSYPVLLILSGRDLTAEEFKETVKGDPKWQLLLGESRITCHDFSEADHTFSSAEWREQVAWWTREWIKILT